MFHPSTVLWGLLWATVGVGAASAQTFLDTGLYASGNAGLSTCGFVASSRNANGGDTLALMGYSTAGNGAWVWQGNNPTNSTGTALFTLASWASGAGEAMDLNSNGTLMAGRFYGPAPSGANVMPYVYTIGSAYNSAANLNGYDSGNAAVGVSNSGVVAFADGQYLLPGGTQANPLPGGAGQEPAHGGMSGNGTIAGTSATPDTGLAEIWTPTTSGGPITGYNNPITFGNVALPFSAGSWGIANAVNDSGNAAGTYGFQGNSDPYTYPGPALFSGNGSSNPNVFSLSPYVTVGGPYGFACDAGEATSINSNGTVVGWDAFGANASGFTYGTGTPLNGHAFIWTPTTPNGTTGAFQDLNTVYASILPSGVVLNDAVSINDRGDILCVASGGTLHTREFVLISTTLPGDANLDGRVDINDLTIVLAHYNQTGMGWSQGEFTGSGAVDINDLTIVLAHYNQTSGSSAAGSPSAVPEPGAMAILAAASIGLLACAWRKRR